MVDVSRTAYLKETVRKKGPVVYWMSRDMRIFDNWAFLFAADHANKTNQSLWVVFTLAPNFLRASFRHYHFLIEGLKEVEQLAMENGIGFRMLMGEPSHEISTFVNEIKASLLVSDFDPLRIKQSWKNETSKLISIPHIEVDAHNIVPCKIASQKAEFGAYTIRPKINRLLTKYLTDFPQLPNIAEKQKSNSTNWNEVLQWLKPSTEVKPVNWITPGYTAASKTLNDFLNQRLPGYAINRNNPLIDGQSNLSPYLHFGHISAQRVASEAIRSSAPEADKSAFLEELIVRRELSDNFCFYNPNYDNPQGFHSWATETLTKHEKDEREYTYSQCQLEHGNTHDKLWNAAQKQMVKTGKMHGYMRMYWAKKILEWSSTPALAMINAIYLNDKYSLDGRDPNGYAGIAWSIGGVHDRAWSERPVFGKIRYMNYNGCKRKFNVDGYIDMHVNIKNDKL